MLQTQRQMNEARDEACAAVDGATMMAHVREFAKRIKHAGTAEELESFRYIRDCLDSYGWSTHLIQHDAYISQPGKASLPAGGALPQISKQPASPVPKSFAIELSCVHYR